jgi:hypothetical protein
MQIHGLTVCVNYADLLAQSLDRWLHGLTSLTVVTDLHDLDTVTLIGEQIADTPGPPLRLFRTDAFYLDGAAFNKGRAMQEARRQKVVGRRQGDWDLFFDADVIPPVDWLDRIKAANPQPGRLYGARRQHEDGRLIPDGEIAGFFQLFAASDPLGQQPLDVHWRHAGNYDSTFQSRWPRERREFLPLTLIHRGETGQNWHGRDNRVAQLAMHLERQRRGGWQHETIATADESERSPSL